MNLTKGTIYFPKSRKQGKVRYLSICAHQDDNEIMAIDGIIRGYRARKYAFACITTTNGCGSPRKKEYLDMSEDSKYDSKEDYTYISLNSLKEISSHNIFRFYQTAGLAIKSKQSINIR